MSTPPARVLLCLNARHYGEFYLPLDTHAMPVCPYDRDHPVAVYDLTGAAIGSPNGTPTPETASATIPTDRSDQP